MLTSVVSSSRSLGFGRLSVGVSEAVRTGAGRCGCGSDADADAVAWRCTSLSCSVGKRSLNDGAGKRSTNVSLATACVFAASAEALGALPH